MLGAIARNGKRGGFNKAIAFESMASRPYSGLLVNAAVWNVGGFLRLNSASSTNGSIVWSKVLPATFTASVDMAMSSTSGADSSWFFFGCSSVPTSESTSSGIGYAVERSDSASLIRIRYGGTSLATVAYTKDTSFDSLKIAYSSQAFVITYKGAVVLTYTDPTSRTFPGSLFGFAGRSGGAANTHDIKNALVTT